MPGKRPPLTLYQGDAVSVLRTLPGGSVDAAVFDPPYPTISGGSNADRSGKWQRPSGILTKNDGKIFDHNDIAPDEYLTEVYRVLREDAHLYLMTNVLNLVQKDILGAIRRAGFQVHNLLVWRKNNATPNRWYMKDLEYTIFARKGKAFSINHLGTRSSGDVFPHPLDWDNVPPPKSHPTEKPVNLMATYIQNSTRAGEVVLDPFMGTGATGVAANYLDRGFIGIEMDENYCKAASQRLGVPVEEAEPDIDALLGLTETDPDIAALLA
ncbi:metal dependent phosphohydrolase [Ruegeria phage vB_RpoS-V16]|uniref:DNA methyltransferase n=1 Tax=Ruegeria phage vB_RpoS-V16 TaxID=2218618 RepID=UPI000DCAB5F2|nr:DNA methyltransferase [Ruegeria phage vB_RpoS-V16]AWY09473.1 metal dependent phosphohydrolase [Ruegeria phage vB_RpoS-V16]